jgi:mannose-6-phosphate isomerase-like protein (cupin superfamily)
MGNETEAPIKISRTEFIERDGPKCRTIIAPAPGGGSEPAVFEWELRAESWTDRHPHTELNYVIEGELFVESGGVTVQARAGDLVRVPAGATGRYWAPTFARLIAIYGLSQGEPSARLGYEKLVT